MSLVLFFNCLICFIHLISRLHSHKVHCIPTSFQTCAARHGSSIIHRNLTDSSDWVLQVGTILGVILYWSLPKYVANQNFIKVEGMRHLDDITKPDLAQNNFQGHDS